MFLYKRLVEHADPTVTITIYEKSDRLGAGMPYSASGANDEHITNVSGNEIPELVTTVSDWICTVPKDTLDKFKIDPERFNEYKVLPRLLFGQYLTEQFRLLMQQAKEKGIETIVNYNTAVADVVDYPDEDRIQVVTADGCKVYHHRVAICTGHFWPKKYEGKVEGYFDSPYPPSKLTFKADHEVAIRGSSLTAIDAIRTLSRYNGSFDKDADGKLTYEGYPDSQNFRMVMHSRNGLLPAMRFHLEDSHLGKNTVLSADEVKAERDANNGFLPLDYVFENNFKDGIKQNDPEFYARIKDMQMEEFVDLMMGMRERRDAFELLQAEYDEAERSIKKRESIYWKEMLGILSFAMNYPAKYFSAEDMLRVQKTLMPLISIVIAYVPQSSAGEMLALHSAGVLDIVAVGDDSTIEPAEGGGVTVTYTDEDGGQKTKHYATFVDCIGQPHLAFSDIPYKSLVDERVLTPAKLKFSDPNAGQDALAKNDSKVTKDSTGDYYLTVPGVAINDSFEAVDGYGAFNGRIYILAVPYIGGFNPDYSGLDFGEAASALVIKAMMR
ncbi:FAD/NAD(P)-binding protein [Mucilaginibacter sp. JRF]|nr:FAD/NAD(P)-binding protein [Mucilaginibacter sp. JRF]